jgi:O-acetyl-ADP-ribose deacetylase (regulator of RNase III)
MKTPVRETRRSGLWTHPSVLLLHSADPIAEISARANGVTLEAMQAGWSGPPFDPSKLADHLGIAVVPRAEVAEAQTIPIPGGGVRIEYNPNRPAGRVRFSIAHELAHTLFPDCERSVRYRLSREQQRANEWQLEMLCNIAAAQFLMPLGSFPELKNILLDIDRIQNLRKEFAVSTEAILLRVIRITEQPCAIFVASSRSEAQERHTYRFDYVVSSRNWQIPFAGGDKLPSPSRAMECTAIGYTAKADEVWPEIGPIHVEYLGIPSFPGETRPRVVGILRPPNGAPQDSKEIKFLAGDATLPRGDGPKIVAHVVNDKTPLWGAGFGLAVRKKWPEAQSGFRQWVERNPELFRLGSIFSTPVTDEVIVCQLICQHGYGPSHPSKPRLRYAALKQCLGQLANFAQTQHASVHMPRIGAGHGGGAWGLIEQLIDETVAAPGVSVTVYDLPDFSLPSIGQRTLF